MRIEAYLMIYGDEKTIHAIDNQTNIPGASVKQHSKVEARWSATGQDAPWSWSTSRVPIDPQNFDEGLKAFLNLSRPIFPAIKKHKQTSRIYLQTITYYEPNERHSGVYLSAETISLLSELGAAFDDDVYESEF